MMETAAGRAVVWAGAVALAVAVGVSADRSDGGPGLIARMSGTVSPAVQTEAAAKAFLTNRSFPSEADRAAAMRLAVADPLSPLPFMLAGATRGDQRLVTLSLQRDPRFQLAYSLRMLDGAKAGDVPAMTRALVGLAAVAPNDGVFQGLVQLTVDPQARAIIKPKLLAGVAWRDAYLSILGASSIDKVAVFDMLQGVPHRSGTDIASNAASSDRHVFIAGLVQKQEYERAYLAWVQWLPVAFQGELHYIFDGDFKGLDALPPFGWQIGQISGGSVTIDASKGLSADYAGTDGVTLAQQTLMLPAGRYRLKTVATFQAASAGRYDDADGPVPIAWTLTCLPGNTPLAALGIPLAGKAVAARGQSFAVTEDCQAQRLDLAVSPMEFSRHLSGTIRSIEVEAAR